MQGNVMVTAFVDDDNPILHLVHAPIRPPRESHAGEVAYLQAWQELLGRYPEASDQNTMIEHILRHFPFAISQEIATMLASFAMWLGTNVGQAFVAAARNAVSKRIFPTDSDCWIAVWSVENRRQPWVNYGVRYIEFIGSTDARAAGRRDGQIGFYHHEAVEAFVAWLAEDEGKAFLGRAEVIRAELNKAGIY